MSRVEVTHGTAVVTVDSVADTVNGRSLFPHYRPVDVLDAACAALNAINTPDAVRLAAEVYKLTALNLGPRRADTPRPTEPQES